MPLSYDQKDLARIRIRWESFTPPKRNSVVIVDCEINDDNFFVICLYAKVNGMFRFIPDHNIHSKMPNKNMVFSDKEEEIRWIDEKYINSYQYLSDVSLPKAPERIHYEYNKVRKGYPIKGVPILVKHIEFIDGIKHMRFDVATFVTKDVKDTKDIEYVRNDRENLHPSLLAAYNKSGFFIYDQFRDFKNRNGKPYYSNGHKKIPLENIISIKLLYHYKDKYNTPLFFVMSKLENYLDVVSVSSKGLIGESKSIYSTLENYIKNRKCFVYAHPNSKLSIRELQEFANKKGIEIGNFLCSIPFGKFGTPININQEIIKFFVDNDFTIQQATLWSLAVLERSSLPCISRFQKYQDHLIRHIRQLS